MQSRSIRGRGAPANPPARFDRIHYEPDPDLLDPDDPGPLTQLIPDGARSIISTNASPDVPFDASLNPYRGCEHGCSYCYARPTHEYLGFSAGVDFETRILVKHEAPALLRKALSSRRWQPKVLALSGVTDPYQPAESRLGITRACLRVLADFRNPVAVITKNHRVTRDIDLLAELAAVGAAAVSVSVTTLERDLQRVLEPRTSTPRRRLAAIEALAKAGIPVRVMVAPVIPGLTDHELPAILEAAALAGARGAGFIPLRLPHGVKDLFERWLEVHLPEKKARVLNRVREIRGGELNDARFGSRMRGEGPYAEHIRRLFQSSARRTGLDSPLPALRTDSFRRSPAGDQLALFGE